MLPASFARDGFLPPDKLTGKFKRLLIGTEGRSNTGKSEFTLSAPGPTIELCLDRGFESMLDNPNPPTTRRNDFALKIIPVQMAETAGREVYMDCWKNFRNEYNKALANLDARTVVVDGDSDSWELQRLAEWGKISQVGLAYASVNAARRAMITRKARETRERNYWAARDVITLGAV